MNWVEVSQREYPMTDDHKDKLKNVYFEDFIGQIEYTILNKHLLENNLILEHTNRIV